MTNLAKQATAPKWIHFHTAVMLTLIFVAMAGSAAVAAPITFNTALPVAKGEGILRIQSKYVRSTDDPTPMDRKLDVWSFPVVGVYGLTEKWAVFGIAPILVKQLRVTAPTGRRTRDTEGLGDMRFFSRYTVGQWDRPGQTLRIAPFAGIEVPTGKDNETDSLGRLPQPLQLGSGSWDPFAGIVMTQQTLNWQWDAAASYQFNTEGNAFRFGDEARLDLSYQHRLWPRQLGAGVPVFIYGVLESNLIWQAKNKVAGATDDDSGGTTLFITPGIQCVSKRLVIEAALQVPVVQDLNGGALENDFISTLSLRINF